MSSGTARHGLSYHHNHSLFSFRQWHPWSQRHRCRNGTATAAAVALTAACDGPGSHTHFYKSAPLPFHFIPFHSIVLFQATSSIQTKQRLDKKTENQYREKGQKHRKHKTHSKTINTLKTYIHIYTTRSDFTKALLLALQRVASDFLAYDFENR